MNFESLLAEGRLRHHETNQKEIGDLLRVAERDLSDARVSGLSSDRRFLIAYDAALALATIPLHCEGYRTHGAGHHWMTFGLLPRFMGAQYSALVSYFDMCRTNRNIGTYDRGGQISNSEAYELIEETESSDPM
jgi:hypothetical protein